MIKKVKTTVNKIQISGRGAILGLLYLTAIVAVMSAGQAQEDRKPAAEGYQIDIQTYLGDGIDGIRDVDVDDEGNIYATGGVTNRLDLPNSLQPEFGGRQDVIVIKISREGKLLWWRLIGGPNHDRAYAVEVGPDGAVYLAGRAGEGFPTTAGVVQPQFGGDIESRPGSLYGRQDGFLVKLDREGKLLWSSYFGGKGDDFIRDIDVDDRGVIHVAATSVSFPFPHIPKTGKSTHSGRHDGVISRVGTDGKAVLWAVYIGGSGDDFEGPSIRVDREGNTYAAGSTNSTDLKVKNAFQGAPGGQFDLHLVKYGSNGEMHWHTYIGGPMDEGTETHMLAVDNHGAPVVGITTLSSTGLPVTAKSYDRTYNGAGGSGTGQLTNYPGDVYLIKYSPDGNRIMGSTYFGGRFGEGIEGINVDKDGNVYLSGATYSPDLPVVAPVQERLNGAPDYFAAKFSPDLSRLIFSTFLGGNGWDAGRASAIGRDGTFVISGEVHSTDIPAKGAQIAPAGRGGKDNAVLVVLRRK